MRLRPKTCNPASGLRVEILSGHFSFMERGWIGVDLDGTLARYDTWLGEDHIGEPIIGMVQRVNAWLNAGKCVKIVTGRVYKADPDVIINIENWCQQHIGQRLEVTCCKDSNMIELWDDRAIQVGTNTGEPIVEHYAKTGRFNVQTVMTLYRTCCKLIEEHTETRTRGVL